MSRVLVPLATGFEEIEAVSIIDVLRRAEIEVLVASLGEKSLVRGTNGIVIQTDVCIKDISTETLDMIVLPGGWDGTHALAEDANVQRVLKEMDAEGKNIAAICAAPYALNKAGVLKDEYTCYPSVEDDIKKEGYQGYVIICFKVTCVEDDIKKEGYQGDKAMVVESQNIMTSRGPATALCFALSIVKKLKGQETFEAIKSGLLASYCQG